MPISQERNTAKTLALHGREIAYTIRRSIRARRLRLTISCDGSVVLTLPQRLNEGVAERFLAEKARWVLSKLALIGSRPPRTLIRGGHREYLRHKDAALRMVRERIPHLNQLYGYHFNEIRIKNQKTRWGSCSKNSNLNFNYKIIFLSEQLRDYIIVHELCHLAAFDHSRRFWGLVAKTFPDYRHMRRELKSFSL